MGWTKYLLHQRHPHDQYYPSTATVPTVARGNDSYDPKEQSNQQYLENAARLQQKNSEPKRRKNHRAIEEYERAHLGIEPGKSTPAGKLDTCIDTCSPLYSDCIDMTKSENEETKIDELSYDAKYEAKAFADKSDVPTVTELFNGVLFPGSIPK